MSSNIGEVLVSCAFAGVVAGIGSFIAGIRELKVKRTIQNTPTCKINTGAIGTNVEVKGFILVEKEKLVTAPISRKQCALYNLEIQKQKGRLSRNGPYWSTIDSFFSDEGFYLDDDSGATALVMVDGAKIIRKGKTEEFQVRSNQFDNLPPSLDTALRANKKKLKKFKLKKSGWGILSRKYRFLEWRFEPDEYIYVLGFAESGLKVQKVKKPKLKYFLQAKKMIQKNAKLRKWFDANQDGKLDYNELERGARIVAEKLSAKYSQKKLEELIPKTKMIFRKKKPYTFIISNRKEEDLIKYMSLWSVPMIWGGTVLTAACGGFIFWYYTVGF